MYDFVCWGLTSCAGDSTVPAVYQQAFAAVDTANVGETSVNGLSRVLGTSGLPASMIERVPSQSSTLLP